MFHFAGNIIYDFFIGHELNPRIGSFDLKFFCELRPGLIGWFMLNLMYVTKAYSVNGQLPPALTMVAFFQGLYVADALWFEVRNVLSCMYKELKIKILWYTKWRKPSKTNI